MIFLTLNCQLDNFQYTFFNFQKLLKTYKFSFQNRTILTNIRSTDSWVQQMKKPANDVFTGFSRGSPSWTRITYHTYPDFT